MITQYDVVDQKVQVDGLVQRLDLEIGHWCQLGFKGKDSMGSLCRWLCDERREELEWIVGCCDRDRKRWKDRPSFRLHRGCRYSPDVWLLVWRQLDDGGLEGTEIHDHADSEAFVKVITGKIIETVYRFDQWQWKRRCSQPMDFTSDSRVASAGDEIQVPFPYIHVFDGCGGERVSATMHVYYPPLQRMSVYRNIGQRLEWVEQWDDPERCGWRG